MMIPISSPQLDPDQQRALDLMLSGHNVFLTGKAGTGKSTVVALLRQHNPRNTVFLAPTGLAALRIGGSTIHRYLGLPTCMLPPGYAPPLSPDRQAVISATHTVVVDEISMVRADLFTTLEATLRALPLPGGGDLPFGGRQVVVVGDFLQLAPVVVSADDRKTLDRDFGGVFAFQTEAWTRAGFAVASLNEPHRQGLELRFVEALDAIRQGQADPAALQRAVAWLNANTAVSAAPADATVLCTTNARAATVNQLRDAMLDTPPVYFVATVMGTFEEDMYPTEQLLALRVGSRAMLLCNALDAAGLPYANGDTGTVVNIDPVRAQVQMVLDDGRCVVVGMCTWLNCEYTLEDDPWSGLPCVTQRAVGWFTQLPVKLAYAVTIHKAQGMSLDRVHLDLGRGAFAPGQSYVGLSRSRSLAGLSLQNPISPMDAFADPSVLEFYGSFAETTVAALAPSIPPQLVPLAVL